VEVGEARLYEEALNTPHVWDARKGFAAVWSVINQSLPITYKVIKERLIPGQTIMVGTTLALVARMVQEETGTPLVTVHLAPSCIISQHQPPVGPDGSLPQSTPLFLKRLYVSMLDNLILDKACKDDINNFRKPLGLPPVKQVFSKWLHSADKSSRRLSALVWRAAIRLAAQCCLHRFSGLPQCARIRTIQRDSRLYKRRGTTHSVHSRLSYGAVFRALQNSFR
jgi:hypothetical protein